MNFITCDDLPAPPSGKSGWPWTIGPSSEKRWPNNTPKVSIVTPSFNQDMYLEECIRSVLLQGYPNLEYIVMDGGSSDQSIEVIKKYERWISYWKSAPDGGQSSAINEGFSIAGGEVLGWLNSDDLLLPDALNTVTHSFANGCADIVTGSQLNCDENGAITGFSMATYYGLKPTLNSVILLAPQLHQAATFWSSELWLKSGGFVRPDLKFAMDADLWVRMFALKPKAKVIHLPLAVFRRHRRQKTADWSFYEAELNSITAGIANKSGALQKVVFLVAKCFYSAMWHSTRHPRVGLLPRKVDPEQISRLGRVLVER